MSDYRAVALLDPKRLPAPSRVATELVPIGFAPLSAAIRRPVQIGYVTVALFILTFGGWGTLAPLAGGADSAGRR